ncbi:E3 ubiquitin-protein ligase UPL7 isoform X2 [Tripterygium wilfordii]|uniref:E3 ubiquitin-protein ligase UPL7 isoform X2 n=1 Tax=Tripterygium wilfordii TaxID=458696 RepID=UPI0018F7EC2A|nr:E3 ubiquitin-protein ligase UPL7 isoform X2 [Tripterygium wilfordii]
MDQPRKHQVSLRGASAREIARDALLEKVSQERELRSYARRANAAAIFIQKVWRRYNETKKVALQMEEEWEILVNSQAGLMTATWISITILRPFLFFITCLSIRHQKIRTKDVNNMKSCFQILLESMKSCDTTKNFCSLPLGTNEERGLWTYQAQKLISLSSYVLEECEKSCQGDQSVVFLASLAMRLLVVLTDLKSWKSVTNDNLQDADEAVKKLIWFMGSCKSRLYISIRRYISNLDVSFSSQTNSTVLTDDKFLITASAITLALRPFHATKFDVIGTANLDVHYPVEQYCSYILTIPWLTLRLPAVFIPALKHKSILSTCLQTLLILRENILTEVSMINSLEANDSSEVIPPVGWALANIIYLAAGNENDFVDPGGLNQGLDYALYVRVVVALAENMVDLLDSVGLTTTESQDLTGDAETSASKVLNGIETAQGSLKILYMDLLKPVSQQWHLTKLLAISKKDTSISGDVVLPPNGSEYFWKLELIDIAYFYSHMLGIFSVLNPTAGSLTVLNMLSFTPGYLLTLWQTLEGLLFPEKGSISPDDKVCRSKTSQNKKDDIFERNKRKASKWANVLNRITGKSQAGIDDTDFGGDHHRANQVDEDSYGVWDIEPLRCGPQGISKDLACLLHLFSATYSHLLLVLDDIEFYEKQVPFMLEQQRRIASVLNTLVYNSLSHGLVGQKHRALMDSAIRCLHLMYERDCRHQFCPPVLWVSPARRSRPPIAVAARAHGVLSASARSEDVSTVPSMGSVITITPHVFPFEERVQMFREFINIDKVSRKMAGEVSGPGSRAVEIVVRRGHIVEDGFRQLNSLGSKLKSSIHVSFVSECGLPEAGLDYGGLSKEFLTDLSKAAFAPEYGIFSQTSTSDGLLIPNAAAKYLENGMQMIEFLGRIVGKALYEGILLDYSFSHVFVQKILGRYSFLDELSTLDPELYRNLLYVKQYEDDVKDLSLDFTVTEESFGKRHVIELKPGGKDACVTNENKMQYIHAMADYKLNRQILPFSNAFNGGLTDLISPSWLRLFNASEFNQLLSGGDHDIDVDDLRSNAQYSGGYSEGSRTIKLFWEIMNGFEPRERCMLLKFVTSCSRAPLLGFKYLQPSFTIHKEFDLI